MPIPDQVNDASDFGHFEGAVVTEWITPDREMRLVEEFAYIDPSNTAWRAPAGATIDGASIPRVLWTLVGSPFTGHYRNASVVHDVACVSRIESWQRVHRMFYSACRCGGVGELSAKTMYAAVYHFGPRWHPDGIEEAAIAPPSEELMADLEQYVRQENPSLDAIESFPLTSRYPATSQGAP
jgi:hypothetical protein